ncbi:MAG TPA: hypothetical protein VER12_07035 [Polyangiaceae bacterium]|nr:hypothetical protein [Polyangiaceae bacterium]
MRSKIVSRASVRAHGPVTEPNTPGGAAPRALLTAALAAVALGAACGGNGSSGGAAGAGAMNPPSGAGTGTASAGNGSTPLPGAGAGGAAPSNPGGGAPASTAGGPTGSASGAGGALAAAGSGGGGFVIPPMTNTSDHCLYGYNPEPSDDSMKAGYATFSASGQKDDTVVQPEVLKWMTDNKWMGAHVVWHAVRGCTDGTAGGLLGPLGFPNICKDYPVLIPADQNCKTAGDGYQFLLFHRHMLQSLKQLWPKHAADFAGFPTWPKAKADVPAVFDAPNWSATVLAAADIGDNIDKPENLAKFPSEGVLGHWLQCSVGTQKLSGAPDEPYIGLHFNLHDQWSRGANSPHGLNNGQVNITNYMFWKLHGWIDNVWEKYRVAKGITKDPAAMQKYNQDIKQSCNEMDIEVSILKANANGGLILDCPPDVDETGDFHTKVRPIFESATNHCASCHGPSQTSPYANLTLGGQVSSKCIVGRLKRASLDGGQIKLIEPGDPEHSWLYLKAAGLADTAGCVASDPNRPCNTATMPPGGSGKTMTDAELTILRDWIKAGAAGPP